MYHEHKLKILKYSAKNIWLLIFPLIRGIRAYRLDVDKLYTWLRGAWFDIAVIGVIIIFGLIRWYFSLLTVNQSSIIHIDGVFIKTRKEISYPLISTLTTERPFLLRPFGVVRIYCSTRSIKNKKADISLIINRRVYSEMMKYLPTVETKNEQVYYHRPDFISVIIFSLFFSSSLSGALYIAAFFFKGGDMARDVLTLSLDRITHESTKISGYLIAKIPTAAIVMGAIFISTWLISFLINIFRYSRFSLRSDGKRIELICGALTRRSYNIKSGFINYTDLRQNLVMKMFRAVSVNVSCAGYGSSSKQVPVILPIRRDNSFYGGFENIASLSGCRNEFRPKLTSVWQYIWLPVIISAAVYPVVRIIELVLPGFENISSFVLIMVEIPLIWLIFVKITAAFTSKITVGEEKIKVASSNGFRFHTIIAERSRIAQILITQTVFQRISKKCTIKFYFSSERPRVYSVKGITMKSAEDIACLLGYEIALDKNDKK